MLEHSPLANDIPHAFGAHHYGSRSAGRGGAGRSGEHSPRRTFIFADILECKGQAGIFALDNADLAKGAFAHDAQEAEVVEVNCGDGQSAFGHPKGRGGRGSAVPSRTLIGERDWLALPVAHCITDGRDVKRDPRAGGRTATCTEEERSHEAYAFGRCKCIGIRSRR